MNKSAAQLALLSDTAHVLRTEASAQFGGEGPFMDVWMDMFDGDLWICDAEHKDDILSHVTLNGATLQTPTAASKGYPHVLQLELAKAPQAGCADKNYMLAFDTKETMEECVPTLTMKLVCSLESTECTGNGIMG